MKKIIYSLFASMLVFAFSAVSAAEKIDINDAFKKGLISITIMGKASGEMVELRIKKLPNTAPIIVVIKKGRTDLGGEVSILSNKEKEIDLTSRYDDIFIIAQTGPDRVTGGPITLDPAKSK
jgi:hypothetical protein